MIQKPHVVIVGAGFGGLYAARALRRANAQITVIDRRNHHVFQPLLYQVAMAALNPSDIAAPIRGILHSQKNTGVILGEVLAIDPKAGSLMTDTVGEVTFDYLILATGATHSYFGHQNWDSHAPGLKTLEDALEIRRRVLLAFEAAEIESDPAAQREWLTFVVVGAGPTGVELAGSLAEIARHSLATDFRNFDPRQSRVILIEGTERVLPPYPAPLSEKARRQLVHLGVEVQTGRIVTTIDEHGVRVGEERIAARTILWAAGVQASPLGRALGVPVDRAGRVIVTPTLTVPGHDRVFVIGDLALFEQDGKPVPGVAPAAIQQGKHTGRNIVRILQGEAPLPFRYNDKGSLATIGRAAAVADFGRFQMSGLPAWLAWLGIHILFLIGFRSRFLVMIQWAWAYITYQRGARLITGRGDLRK